MPHQIRSMAEALGRMPPGSACSDMSKHIFFGTAQSLNPDNPEYGKNCRPKEARTRCGKQSFAARTCWRSLS
jgi:hypothetical protein